MFGTAHEKAAQWGMLLLLLLSIAAPFLLTYVDAIALPRNWLGEFATVLLVISACQALTGIGAWVMLCKDNPKGKRLLNRLYIPSFILYGLYGAFLLILLFIPGTVNYIPEVIFVLAQFLVSAGVLALQYVWKRYSL